MGDVGDELTKDQDSLHKKLRRHKLSERPKTLAELAHEPLWSKTFLAVPFEKYPMGLVDEVEQFRREVSSVISSNSPVPLPPTFLNPFLHALKERFENENNNVLTTMSLQDDQDLFTARHADLFNKERSLTQHEDKTVRFLAKLVYFR